jgi:arginyl-tRNA synthetase
VISSDLRRALCHAVAVAGFPPGADLGLRPTGRPGQYAASIALTLGGHPRDTARDLAAALAAASWIEKAEVTGPGYLTITVTTAALAAVADRVTEAGPGCVASDALAGVTVPGPPPGDPLAAATWEEARAALAALLTARLAAAAGATVADFRDAERERVIHPPGHSSSRPGAGQAAGPSAKHLATSADGPGAGRPRSGQPGPGPDAGPRQQEGAVAGEIAAAVAFAGRDAVTFALARAIPGRPLRVEPEVIARHVAGNPAYAVRYAHARAASGVRWALASRGGDATYPPLFRRPGGPATRTVTWGDTGDPVREAESAPRPPADPVELALLDALSWLPERVAVAARRGRPDEFARYLEDLAGVTVDVLSSVRDPGNAAAPGSGRLTLAMAARTGLAAGLGLLQVSAPERL